MDNEKLSAIAKSDHDEAVEIHKDFLNFAEKTLSDFLTIKMAFLAFFGVIFSIIMDDDGYTRIFKFFYISVIILSFLLLIDDLWQKFKRHQTILNTSEKDAILCNIRYSAASCAERAKNQETKIKFLKIGADAEQMVNKDRKIHNLVNQGKNVEEIINEVQLQRSWKLDFILWSFLFLFIPILFLMEFLHLL